FGLALLGAEQRWLRDVEVAVLDNLDELAEKERQQQRADVRSVNVRVGHDHDRVIAQLAQVLVVADSHSERRDQDAQLLRRQHLVDARALDVQNFAAQRQNSLGLAIAALLGRPACRRPLDQVQLAARRVALLAVRQLARQRSRIERALAPHELLGFARSLARGGSFDRARDDLLRHRRRLLQELAELLVYQPGNDSFDFGVAELGLGLAFELRLGNFYADDRGETLTRVVALEPHFFIFEEAVLGRVVVDRPGQRRLESRQMRPALGGVNVVGVGENHLVDRVGPLQRDLDIDALAHALEENHVVKRFVALAQSRNVFGNPAFVVKLFGLVDSLVAQPDSQACVEVRHLAQVARNNFVLELYLGKDLGVRCEGGLGALAVGRAALFDLGFRKPALVALKINLAVFVD